MNGLHVRAATAADVAHVRRLLADAGLPVADLDAAPALQFWVAEDDGAVVGAIGLERYGSAALLRSLVVVQAQRRRGLGQALVAALEAAAHRQRIEVLVLLTETAAAFFSRAGYQRVDRDGVPAALKDSAEFRSLCPASAACMAKALAAVTAGGAHG